MYLSWIATELWEKKIPWESVNLWSWTLYSKVWIDNLHYDVNWDELKLADIAIHKALETHWITVDMINHIVVATSSTFRYSTPGVEHILAAKLWVSKECSRDQIWNNCTWAVKALVHWCRLMQETKLTTWEEQICLVVVADKRSSVRDMRTMPMVSDASWVMILSTIDLWSTLKISDEQMMYGEYSESELHSIVQWTFPWWLIMPDWKWVFDFAVETGAKLFETLDNIWDSIYRYVPHNANITITQAIQKKLWSTVNVHQETIKLWNLWGVSVIHGLQAVLLWWLRSWEKVAVWAFWANLEWWGFIITKE